MNGESPSQIDPLRLLVVEDDDNHAEIILRSLRRTTNRLQADRVSDGEQALAFLRGEGPFADKPLPDLILLDLNLPRVDGYRVLQAIKCNQRWHSIPVVILSTSNSPTDRREAYRCGANSYLVKPIRFEKFRELLRELIAYWGTWNRPVSDR